jgi:predicted adenine nucleotide alpha hydrolase (AANH) superfamily ATPase
VDKVFKIVLWNTNDSIMAFGLGRDLCDLTAENIAARKMLFFRMAKDHSVPLLDQCKNLISQLRGQLHRSESILAILSSDAAFKNLNLAPHLVFYIPSESAPIEIRRSQAWLTTNLKSLPTTVKPPKENILLHVCCGPDAAGVIDQLRDDFNVLAFWYDPNIQPRTEYDLRLKAFEEVARIKNIPTIIGDYDVDKFLATIRGLEYSPEKGAKCSKCYDMRLERSAVEALRQHCTVFTTTLAMSPKKVQEKLRVFGELAAAKHGLSYLAKNFMKDDGYRESTRFTHAHNIYRQDYCGCYYSLNDGGPRAQELARSLGYDAKPTNA